MKQSVIFYISLLFILMRLYYVVGKKNNIRQIMCNIYSVNINNYYFITMEYKPYLYQ